MTPERIAELRAIPRPSFTNDMRAEMLDEIERLGDPKRVRKMHAATITQDPTELRLYAAALVRYADHLEGKRDRPTFTISTWCPHCNVMPSSGVHICPRPYPVERGR